MEKKQKFISFLESMKVHNPTLVQVVKEGFNVCFESYDDDPMEKSFNILIKYNNGFFKSDKQRDFLLSRCDNGEYTLLKDGYVGAGTGGEGMTAKNQYHITFFLDNEGIYKKTKNTRVKGLTTVWERKSDNEFQEIKSQNDLDRSRRIEGLTEKIKKIYDAREELTKVSDEMRKVGSLPKEQWDNDIITKLIEKSHQLSTVANDMMLSTYENELKRLTATIK